MASTSKLKKTNNETVHADAVPEYDQNVHNDEGPARNQQPAAANSLDVITSQAHTARDDNIKKKLNKHLLPPHLKEDNIDFLVLYADADYKQVQKFKELITKNVRFCDDLTPNVVLLKEVKTGHPFKHLDDAYLRSTYILLYVTEDFCQDYNELSNSHACLENALKSSKEKQTIIPVYAEHIRDYELPMKLKSLLSLNEFSSNIIQDLTELLEHESILILKKRGILEKERQEYLNTLSNELNSDLTEPNYAAAPGDIRQVGEFSGCRLQPQQNVEQSNSSPQTTKVFNSFAVEEPPLDYSSPPKSVGGKPVATDLSAHVRGTDPKTPLRSKQNLPVAERCDVPLPKLQSIPMDTTENKENPSTSDKQARNSASAKSSNAPAPVYNIHINHADCVNINSKQEEAH